MSNQSRSKTHKQIETLLAAARKGSDSALGRVLEASRLQLLHLTRKAMLRRPRSGETESDIVQDTFVNATRGFSGFQGTQSHEFLGWLRRILLNRLAEIGRWRRHALTPKKDGNELKQVLAAEVVDPHSSPSSVVRHNEDRDLIRAALAQLPLEQHDVVRLRMERELSFRQIGDELGISEDAARMRYRRAFANLKKQLPRELWDTN